MSWTYWNIDTNKTKFDDVNYVKNRMKNKTLFCTVFLSWKKFLAVFQVNIDKEFNSYVQIKVGQILFPNSSNEK